MRILLIEDDVKIASFVVKGLKSAGYAIDHAIDGEDGLNMALTEPYDAAIIDIDIMLPKLDGLSLIEMMRKEKAIMPVIILSAKGSVDGRARDFRPEGTTTSRSPLPFTSFLPVCRH